MNEIIKYINENDIETMVQAVVKSKKDIWNVIEQVRASRVEYQGKSQHFQDALAKHLPELKLE